MLENNKKIISYIYIFCLSSILFFTKSSLQLYNGFGTNLFFLLYKFSLFLLIVIVFFRLIFYSEISKNVFNANVIIILMSFVNFLITRDNTFLVLCFVALMFCGFSNDEIAKVYFYFNLISLIIIISFFKIGFLKNINYVSNGNIKNSFGFIYPNTLGITLLVVNIAYVFIKKENIKITNWLLILIIDFLVLYYSQSRTSMYLVILIYALWIIFNRFRSKLFLKIMCVFSFSLNIFLFLITLLLGLYKGNSSWYMSLNNYLTGRLKLMQFFFREYGISFWGQKVSYLLVHNTIINYNYQILDNSYAKLLINYGVFVSFVYLLIISNIILYSYKYNDKWILIPIIIFSLLGFFEQSMLYYLYNFSILFYINSFKNARNRKV